MTITIIGTNGFLSTALAKFFCTKGCDLNMLGKRKPIGHDYKIFKEVNIVNELIDYKFIVKSDIIIYAVGAGIQSNLNESNDLIYNLNVTVPVTIANHLKKFNFTGTFITFGSVFEMGSVNHEKFFTESDILLSNAKSPNDYTVSKRMLTRFISSYSHDFIHWHFILPTIYGENENPLRLIPYTINSLRTNKALNFTSGEQTRQYIYVNDVSIIIDKCIQKKLPNGIFNIGGEETLSVRDLVTLIHKVFNMDISDECFGKEKRSDASMKYLALDNTKLYSHIKYNAVTKITDVIKLY